jgi:hypothetical protein
VLPISARNSLRSAASCSARSGPSSSPGRAYNARRTGRQFTRSADRHSEQFGGRQRSVQHSTAHGLRTAQHGLLDQRTTGCRPPHGAGQEPDGAAVRWKTEPPVGVVSGARSEMRRTSQPSASARPAPAACPVDRSQHQERSRGNQTDQLTQGLSSPSIRFVAPLDAASRSARSAPRQNARPAPVSTATRVTRSAASARNAAVAPASISASRTLPRSGRSSVSTPTAPSTLTEHAGARAASVEGGAAIYDPPSHGEGVDTDDVYYAQAFADLQQRRRASDVRRRPTFPDFPL